MVSAPQQRRKLGAAHFCLDRERRGVARQYSKCVSNPIVQLRSRHEAQCARCDEPRQCFGGSLDQAGWDRRAGCVRSDSSGGLHDSTQTSESSTTLLCVGSAVLVLLPLSLKAHQRPSRVHLQCVVDPRAAPCEHSPSVAQVYPSVSNPVTVPGSGAEPHQSPCIASSRSSVRVCRGVPLQHLAGAVHTSAAWRLELHG